MVNHSCLPKSSHAFTFCARSSSPSWPLKKIPTKFDSSQNRIIQTHVYAFIEGRIARYDGPRLLTQVRLHCAPDVTAPHSFNMLLQHCKEQKLSVISRKHSTTAGGTLCTQNWHNVAAKDHVTIQNGHRITTPTKFAPRHNERSRNDPRWPPHHTANLPPRRPRDDRATSS